MAQSSTHRHPVNTDTLVLHAVAAVAPLRAAPIGQGVDRLARDLVVALPGTCGVLGGLRRVVGRRVRVGTRGVGRRRRGRRAVLGAGGTVPLAARRADDDLRVGTAARGSGLGVEIEHRGALGIDLGGLPRVKRDGSFALGRSLGLGAHANADRRGEIAVAVRGRAGPAGRHDASRRRGDGGHALQLVLELVLQPRVVHDRTGDGRLGLLLDVRRRGEVVAGLARLASRDLDVVPPAAALVDGLRQLAPLGPGGLLVRDELVAVLVHGVDPLAVGGEAVELLLLGLLAVLALDHLGLGLDLRLRDVDVRPDMVVLRLDREHPHEGVGGRGRDDGRLTGDGHVVGVGRAGRETERGEDDQDRHPDLTHEITLLPRGVGIQFRRYCLTLAQTPHVGYGVNADNVYLHEAIP